MFHKTRKFCKLDGFLNFSNKNYPEHDIFGRENMVFRFLEIQTISTSD